MFTCDSSAVVHELANGGGGSERITSVMFALQEAVAPGGCRGLLRRKNYLSARLRSYRYDYLFAIRYLSAFYPYRLFQGLNLPV